MGSDRELALKGLQSLGNLYVKTPIGDLSLALGCEVQDNLDDVVLIPGSKPSDCKHTPITEACSGEYKPKFPISV